MTRPVSADSIAEGLQSRDLWGCWRTECTECYTTHLPDVKECPGCGENTTKRPVNPETGRLADPTDADDWGAFDDALACHRGDDVETHGIGFLFTEDGQITGVDLDDCRDPESGELSDDAKDIIRKLDSYAEVSPSGTGVHAYVYGEKPEGGNRKDGVEIYSKEHYFTVTGDHLARSPATVNYRPEELETVHSGYVGSGGSNAVTEEELEDIDIPSVEEVEDKEFVNDLGMSLDEIREREPRIDACLREQQPDYTELDGDYENPDNPSTSEYDYSVVSRLWYWRFSKQQIVEIFHKYRYREKVKRPSTYLGAAKGDRYDSRAKSSDSVEILDDRTEYKSIENVDWPDSHFVLDKPPREGGSHASIDQLSDKPLVVLASRHSIAEHHLEILEKVMPDGATAVHHVGGERACEHSGGSSCPKAVVEYGDLLELQDEAKDIVYANRVVTYEDAPERFCNKQFINQTTEFAHTVVTVPNLLPDLDRDFGGHNLLIDEEQALGYFRTPSVDIATISNERDPDGTRRVQASSSNITNELDTLESIKETVHEDQQKRAEENGDGEYRETSREKDVLNAIAYLEEVADTMSIEEISEELGDATAGEVVREIRERLSEIERPQPRLGTADFREKIREYVERYYFSDSTSPGSMIEAALFGYDDRKFDFKFTEGGYKLRMIGGRDVFHTDILSKFDQIGIIAGPEGELLFDDLGIVDNVEVIDITEFEYADDFVIVPMGKESENWMEPTSDQRRRSRRVSEILNERAHPHMAITGTKSRANAHNSKLTNGPADIISNPETPPIDIRSNWSNGGSAIIYENSAVSRGIDAPNFDISVVVSSGFATPYWEARKKHYQAEDRGEYEYARDIEEQLKSHELTNAVLRCSPTRTTDHVTGTKFIVCADWDASRIRYISQETPIFENAENAASFLENTTIGGGGRTELERIYDGFEGNDTEFIEETIDAEIRETIHDRPTYTVRELENWLTGQKKYLTREGETMHVAESAVPPDGEVPRDFINGLLPMERGRVGVNLEVLRKMGIVNKETKDGDSVGESATVWKR